MRRVALVTTILVIAGAADGGAQRRTPDFASAFLRPGHWAIDAAGRLHALGLVRNGFDRGRQPLTRREVGRVFEAALPLADRERPELVGLVQSYRDRFAEEFPATVAGLDGTVEAGPRLADGSILAGYELRRGRLRSGVGYTNGENWTGPFDVEDVSTAMGGADWGVELFPYAAAGLTPVRSAGDWSVAGGYATAVWRDAGIWVGRRAFGYTPVASGGIVLNPATPFDGGGVFLTDAVLLPSFLEHLGPFLFETFMSRVEHDGPIERPWVWGMRATLEPHPRFGIGVSRVAMFGGEGKNAPSLKNLAYLVVGKHAGAGSGFDNQVIAIDAWFRPPTGSLPIIVYVEWGIEDSAGAWFDVPGLVMGIEVPALPRAPGIALGLERVVFGPSCCGNPIWYRHWQFLGGWTDDGVPLGHPLGGHGDEWLAWGSADLLEARLRLGSSLYLRDRGEENLYAPDRLGSSVRGAVAAAFRVSTRFDVVFEAGTEAGAADWNESAALLGIRVLF